MVSNKFFYLALNKLLKKVKVGDITMVKYDEVPDKQGNLIPVFRIENPNDVSFTIISLEDYLKAEIDKIASLTSHKVNYRNRYFYLDDYKDSYGGYISKGDQVKFNDCMNENDEVKLKWRDKNIIYTFFGKYGDIDGFEIEDEGVIVYCKFYLKNVFVDNLETKKYHFIEDFDEAVEIATNAKYEDKDVFDNKITWNCFKNVFADNLAFVDYDWMYSTVEPVFYRK